MANLYNRIQGRSLERLAALSDGIFAVAMTLLVLDLHIPTTAEVHGERELLLALGALGPQWVAYGMSFLTLGIFWAGQQTQLNHLAQGTRDLTWIHLAFLFGVTLLPLSTRLLAEFITYRSALLIYWLNILALGVILYWSWKNATREGLIKDDTPPHSHGPESIRGRRGAVRDQHLGEHRRNRARPVELCDCAQMVAAKAPKRVSITSLVSGVKATFVRPQLQSGRKRTKNIVVYRLREGSRSRQFSKAS